MDTPATGIPESLVETLRNAQSVAVLTGSGISAESGVPTFRDAQTGLWARYDPMELATPEAFARDPRLVWEWYSWRRELVEGASPNPGHEALAELERHVPEFVLVTQNVDGLHRRAGSQRVIRVARKHSTLEVLRRGHGCRASRGRPRDTALLPELRRFLAPRCRLVRRDVACRRTRRSFRGSSRL